MGNIYNYTIFLFGVGEYYIRYISEIPLYLQSNKGTLFEMDFFDLFAMYGLIGFTIYMNIVYIMFKLSRINKAGMSILFILALALIHSFLAAHVLFSPQVTTLISLILIHNFYSYPNKLSIFFDFVKPLNLSKALACPA